MKFDKNGLIPVIVQDYLSKEVLMLAYMNEESYQLSLKHMQTYFYSRSRNAIWHKGATSSNYQIIKEIFLDCDNDTLLVLVEQINGIACHTGAKSCFFRRIK